MSAPQRMQVSAVGALPSVHAGHGTVAINAWPPTPGSRRNAVSLGASVDDFVSLVLDELPAYVSAQLVVAGRQVWPPAQDIDISLPTQSGAVPVSSHEGATPR